MEDAKPRHRTDGVAPYYRARDCEKGGKKSEVEETPHESYYRQEVEECGDHGNRHARGRTINKDVGRAGGHTATDHKSTDSTSRAATTHNQNETMSV